VRIKGVVSDKLAPIIKIDIEGSKEQIETILDTGFNGELMLPKKTIENLNLEWCGKEDYLVASGEMITTDVYKGYLNWFDKRCAVEVMATSAEQGLLGMQLLSSCIISINVPEKELFIEKVT
jgi:clan AA aspartic protease